MNEAEFDGADALDGGEDGVEEVEGLGAVAVGRAWKDMQVDGSRVTDAQTAAVIVQDREEVFTRELYVAIACALRLLQRY